jgi:hypothetical protein
MNPIVPWIPLMTLKGFDPVILIVSGSPGVPPMTSMSAAATAAAKHEEEK